MAKLLDYVSAVASPQSGGVSIPVPAAPAFVKLTGLGVTLTSVNNRVQLTTTVGFQSILGVPQLLIQIIRESDQAVIFSAVEQAVNVLDSQTFTLQAVDTNAPLGIINYGVYVQVANGSLLTQANVIGPITLTAMAMDPFQ